MKTASAKAKSRRLQDKVTLTFRNLFNGVLTNGDIKPAIMGTNGTDMVLSPSAKNLIAFDVECKNDETLIGAKLTNAIEQCETNTEEGRIPLLIFKKNNEPERVILKFDDFIELIYPKKDITFGLPDRKKIVMLVEQLKQSILNERKIDGN